MAVLGDIPERDGRDGAEQLTYLRAYLKDSVAVYTYPDSLLIELLVEKDTIDSWRGLLGRNITDIPWSYDITLINEPINRVRVLIEDTVELSLNYTDVDILNLLDILPLRYVVDILKKITSESITYPDDREHPIHILREYLEDVSGEKYKDQDLVDLMLKHKADPYSLVVILLNKSIAENSSEEVTKGTGSLASLDGISFVDSDDALEQTRNKIDTISKLSTTSVYIKDPIYGIYEDGEDITGIDWETRWYALQ